MSKMEEQAEKFKTLLYVLGKFKKRHQEASEVIVGIHEKGSLAGGLRVRVITLLENLYRPVERPTPFQKLHAKVIISIKQGYDGDLAECFYCGSTADVEKGLHVHHDDYQTWNNVLTNLHCTHPGCNTVHSNKKPRQPKSSVPSLQESVNMRSQSPQPNTPTHDEANVRTLASRFTSNEGERHDKVRTRFDRYVADVINGPFSVPKNKRQQDPAYRPVWSLDKLSKWLVNVQELKDGEIKLSSVTFRRWIEEDGEGPLAPFYIDDSQKPYTVVLKEKFYQEQCLKMGIPEAEFISRNKDNGE